MSLNWKPVGCIQTVTIVGQHYTGAEFKETDQAIVVRTSMVQDVWGVFDDTGKRLAYLSKDTVDMYKERLHSDNPRMFIVDIYHVLTPRTAYGRLVVLELAGTEAKDGLSLMQCRGFPCGHDMDAIPAADMCCTVCRTPLKAIYFADLSRKGGLSPKVMEQSSATQWVFT